MIQAAVQIPVLKSGSMKKAQWSTRVLTLDVATATVTVSRKHHPSNVLYHSLHVERVLMWPRIAQSYIAQDMCLMESMLMLRLEGTAVSVPTFSAEVNAQTTNGVGAAADAPTALEPSAASPAFSLTVSDGMKQSRQLTSSKNWMEDAWMIRFTTYESYTVAVRLLMAMRKTDGVELCELNPHAAEDLRRIEAAWVRQRENADEVIVVAAKSP